MKKTKIFLTLSLVLAMVFTLFACSLKLGGEETWESTADNKEGVISLFDGFFEKTFANTNQVITVTSGGETVYVENIDGTSDYVSYADSNNDNWSFIKDGEYIYAMNGEDMNYYMVGEENYNYGYFVYKSTAEIFKMVPEEDGVTFSCVVKGSKKDGKSTETLTLEVKNGDAGSLTISASSTDGLVDTITIVSSQEGTTTTTTMTIAYGGASVTVPDITSWVKEDF